MKTVGIIGGAGLVGSYNTKKFLENGYKVKVSATELSTRTNVLIWQLYPMQKTWNLCN